MNHSNEQLLFSQTYQNVAQLVTASYFSQVPARARHFLIETAADETAIDEAASLDQNKPEREVGSLNGLNQQLSHSQEDVYDSEIREGECFKSWEEKWKETKDCDALKNCEDKCGVVYGIPCL